MSEVKFTKGKWAAYISPVELNQGFVSVESNGGVIYGEPMYRSSEIEDTANAHLIAAAPEMYAMLERAKEVMLNTYDACDYPADGKTDCDICAKDIDELLAKARGKE